MYALRVLYGLLSYLNDREVASPAGTYEEFIAGMDDAVRQRLRPRHVYEFVERLTGLEEAHHCFFLLLDEFDAVDPEVGLVTCNEE